jgi:hypothetical protein
MAPVSRRLFKQKIWRIKEEKKTAAYEKGRRSNLKALATNDELECDYVGGNRYTPAICPNTASTFCCQLLSLIKLNFQFHDCLVLPFL